MGCLRRLENANWCLWVAVYLAVYVVLDVAGLAVLAAVESPGGPGPALGAALAAVGWTLPLHVAALVVATGQLLLLRALSGQSRLGFRLTALGVFVVPPALLLAVTWQPLMAWLLPMHVLMGLLVVQPHARWANADPAPELHRW